MTPTAPGIPAPGTNYGANVPAGTWNFEPLSRKRTFDQYAADELSVCREDASGQDNTDSKHQDGDKANLGLAHGFLAGTQHNGNNNSNNGSTNGVDNKDQSGAKRTRFDVLSRTKVAGSPLRECSVCGRVTQAEHAIYKRWGFACPMSGGRWRRPLVWRWDIEMQSTESVSQFMQAPPP